MGTGAIEANPGAGGGTPPGQPAGSGAPAGGNGSTGNGAPGGNSPASGAAASATTGLDRERLNPLLKGMSEEELNTVFENLLTAARQSMSDGVPAHARQEPAVRPPTLEEFRAQAREMLDPNSDKFAPEQLLNQFFQQNYGGLIRQISDNTMAGVEMQVRSEFPDYDKYAADISVLLKDTPATARSPLLVKQAYYAAKGYRQTLAEAVERQRPPATREPSVASTTPVADELTKDEKETAAVMFRGSEDPEKEFRRAKDLMRKQSIRVPGDPR